MFKTTMKLVFILDKIMLMQILFIHNKDRFKIKKYRTTI